jgi:eukaryotic-like serine/threonine-protein kinase
VQLEPGQVVAGDYRVLHRLAAGGMGAVYVAEQLSTGKKRALKVMHRDLADDAESRRRFLQEARVGSLIASEHVVEVQNAGFDVASGSPFLVMELLEGEDLGARLARGPLPLPEVIAIVGQVCHALAAAHDSNVVHRDLKPENIFLSLRRAAGGAVQVKILDFGIAKIAEQKNLTSATGTPLWLAPEQTARNVITPAADVWALGLLVFRLLTNHLYWRTPTLPSRDQSLVALLAEILKAPLPAASMRAAELGSTLPPGFDGWFARCVARDPRERFQHAREAHQHLAPILNRGAAAAPFATAPRSSAVALPTPAGGQAFHHTASTGPVGPPPGYAGPQPSSAWKWLLVGVALLVLMGGALAVAAIWIVSHEAAQRTEPFRPPPPSSSGAIAMPPDFKDFPGLDGRIGGMVISDNHDIQETVNQAFHTTLTPKLEACVAKVHGTGSVTLMMRARRDGTLESIQTIADLAGPHVTCIASLFASQRVPPPPKDAAVQIMVFFSER